MKIIIHSKYGRFEGKEDTFDQEKYDGISSFLNGIAKWNYICFETKDGEIFLTKAMIDDSIIELVK